MELDYTADMKIDESALDVEWLRQSSLALRYIKHAIYLRRKANMAEQNVKVIHAELIREVNVDPKRTTGKDKPTAQDTEAYYRSNKRHKEAKQAWIDAEYEATYAEMAQKEISWGRKASLENLVTLHGQQYFAGPSVPRDLTKEALRSEQQKRVDGGVAQAMRRRK